MKILGGLVEAIIRYTESNESRYGQTQNINQTHSRKRKQPLREQSQNLETRYRDCEKAMQDPCPKHSKPGRPANHTWSQCYFMQDYRRLVKENASGREDNLTTPYKHGRCQAHGLNQNRGMIRVPKPRKQMMAVKLIGLVGLPPLLTVPINDF